MLTKEEFQTAAATLERLSSTYNEGTTRAFYLLRRDAGVELRFDHATLRIVSSPGFFLHHAPVLWGVCNTLGASITAYTDGETATWELSVAGAPSGAANDDEADRYFDGGTR